eukprot:g50108.t1
MLTTAAPLPERPAEEPSTMQWPERPLKKHKAAEPEPPAPTVQKHQAADPPPAPVVGLVALLSAARGGSLPEQAEVLLLDGGVAVLPTGEVLQTGNELYRCKIASPSRYVDFPPIALRHHDTLRRVAVVALAALTASVVEAATPPAQKPPRATVAEHEDVTFVALVCMFRRTFHCHLVPREQAGRPTLRVSIHHHTHQQRRPFRVCHGLVAASTFATETKQRYRHDQDYCCTTFALFNVCHAPRRFGRLMHQFPRSISSWPAFLEFLDSLPQPPAVVSRLRERHRGTDWLLSPWRSGLALVCFDANCYGVDFDRQLLPCNTTAGDQASSTKYSRLLWPLRPRPRPVRPGGSTGGYARSSTRPTTGPGSDRGVLGRRGGPWGTRGLVWPPGSRISPLSVSLKESFLASLW